MISKIRQNVLANICKNTIIPGVIMFSISLLLILGGIFYGRHQDETEYDAGDEEILIIVLGENVDSLHTNKIDVYFNDCGEIDISFHHVNEKEKTVENIWVFIMAGMPFSWFVEGNTENRLIEHDVLDFSDMKSYRNELTSGESEGHAAFFVKKDNDENKEAIHIRVENKYAYCQKGDFVKINAPYISTLYGGDFDINDMNYMDNWEDFFHGKGVDIDKENAVMEYLLSVGKIDDMTLWPAAIEINSVYRSEKFYKELGYQLVDIFPDEYEKDSQTVSWKNQIWYFFPSIKYWRNQNIINCVLLFIGGVLIPFSIKWIWCCGSKKIE